MRRESGTQIMTDPAQQQYDQLAQFLEADPSNPALLADVASAAFDAGDCEAALGYLAQLDMLEPVRGGLANLAGVAAMRSGDQGTAQSWFDIAADEMPDDPALAFNRAWSKTLAGEFEAASEHLTDSVTDALPQAAMLDMQIAHEQGRLDEAVGKMEAYLAQHADYAPLQAAASVLAMDVDRPDLARESAQKGGNHPDALTTLGSLNLADRRLDEAEAQFAQALATGKPNPRAEIGQGLVALARGDHANAALAIDKGAEQFGDQLGSWIAAGWAHLLAGDAAAAEQRFANARDTDDTFAEAHGSLAVTEILAGRMEEAKRSAEVAARLDRSSFSAALAQIMLANANDDDVRAEKILKRALSTSVLPDGRTLEQAIIGSMAAG